ncbi:mutS protein homolog 5-like [Plutella xylostella]|uniref:mutS protein homolog 5-like n=1 Tax=Plutella xylostella TaxID=51655 RepID=UPI002032C2BD|nr:mutS protein homolog 5-like [Plutella xylostella]
MLLINERNLQVLEEIVDRAPAHQMLSNLIRRVEPSKLLVDGKAQGTFVNMVKKIVFANGNDSAEPACRLIFISAKEYNFEACKRRISSLSLPHEPHNCTEDERAIFLRTILHFGQLQSVHALGALLRYVDLNWSSLSMDLHSKPQFMGLKKISLADIVTIDADTYKGLQIFSPVSHPSGFKKGARASDKEGLSLFSVFNKCASKVGQSRMRVLLQHPTNDMALLRQRQQVVGYFMRAQADTTLRNICSSLRFVKNVNGILTKIKALSAKPYQWKSLYNTLYNTVLICEMCENVAGASDFLDQLGSYDNNKLYEMALYMNRIIDFDLSKTEGKFTVKPGVDPELDRKKQTMAQLHGLMSETAKVELERLPPYIDECTMLYMPHLGYLLGVRAWEDNLSVEQKELPNMRFMFQNNDYIHYKSKGCEELDVMIGDTYPEIVAHETRIMMRLTTIVLENLQTLSAVIDKCAELDCLIAISKVCKEFSFVQPELTHEKVIHITRGKHPLHLLTCDDFVPNDLHSDGDSGFVKIFTGPNASGKSVYMKQVGLIVYLAHIGSFVPADAATIGLLTHIYTRIQSTECIAAHMSAFLIDLRQMSLALQESTSNSLIIVDEFGKGTSEVDGISLLASCINSLLCRELNCPHVLLATHMLQLPEFIIKTPLVKFQVIFQTK